MGDVDAVTKHLEEGTQVDEPVSLSEPLCR